MKINFSHKSKLSESRVGCRIGGCYDENGKMQQLTQKHHVYILILLLSYCDFSQIYSLLKQYLLLTTLHLSNLLEWFKIKPLTSPLLSAPLSSSLLQFLSSIVQSFFFNSSDMNDKLKFYTACANIRLKSIYAFYY